MAAIRRLCGALLKREDEKSAVFSIIGRRPAELFMFVVLFGLVQLRAGDACRAAVVRPEAGRARDCARVDAVALDHTPSERDIGYISRIRPPIFGLVYNPRGLRWLAGLDEKKVFGYEFLRFYGGPSVEHLEGELPGLGAMDVVGYCPGKGPLSGRELGRNIRRLRADFPDKKLLVGPCVDLFEKVQGAAAVPDMLGFELFTEDLDAYLAGKYDKAIARTRRRGVEAFAFLTLFGRNADLEKLEKALRKMGEQKLKVGYTLDGAPRLFDFILERRCEAGKGAGREGAR